MRDFFVRFQDDIRQGLPGFDPSTLVGSPLASLSVDPAHASTRAKGVHRSTRQLGGRTLVITATPVINEQGRAIGQVEEWLDRTAEEAAEREVARLVREAASGSLGHRVNLDLLPTGFIHDTGAGINQILDAVVGPLNAAASYLDRIAKGDIPEKISASYNGDFNVIKNNLNTCIDAINALVEDTARLAAAAVDGRLDVRAEVGRHKGDFSKVVAGVNNTLDAIAAPLDEVVRVLGALAQGNLTERVGGLYRGTFGKLGDDANSSAENLARSVLTIKEATDAINTASKEIAMGNVDLSHRTEEQASSLEETASSMEELSSTVRQNADNAKQANQMAVAASEVARRGGEVVHRVVGTMNGINDSARKIVDIIGVIDGIAFQTNILALNAAVEAARAGEQGRGFAVVAGEVRNLAQRSAAAAKEIKALINDSVDKVEDGVKLVEDAGRTMEDVVVSVRRVTDIMAEIAAASAEQSAGIEEVNRAVTQMDDVTQQNAALVEQAAAAAESLEEQAANLALSVSSFKVNGGLLASPATRGLRSGRRSGGALSASRTVEDTDPLLRRAAADDWTEF
ncbi:ABC transporter permease [Methylococcus sp. EFPC2]|nr:ABC transporter permease [Methylococcus sp. EFPC2]